MSRAFKVLQDFVSGLCLDTARDYQARFLIIRSISSEIVDLINGNGEQSYKNEYLSKTKSVVMIAPEETKDHILVERFIKDTLVLYKKLDIMIYY